MKSLTPARLLAIAAAAAALAVGAVVALSAAGAEPPKTTPSSHLDGVTERRGVLGDPDAPVTVTEFVDLQCPVCAAASREVLPRLIDEYVRTGRVKLEARTLHFLGPDSVTAARAAVTAQRQDRLWRFLEAFYAKQGPENSGYVTHAFLDDVARAAGVTLGDDTGASAALERANRDAARHGVNATPTFVIERDGEKPQVVSAGELLGALA